MNKKVFFFTLLIVAGLVAFSLQGQKIYSLGRSVPVGQQISPAKIDHASFDQLLEKYVDKDGLVDYKSWKASSADRKLLQNYLSHLSTANPQLEATKDSKLAFWINAYNAVTIEGILQKFPTPSIRNHTAKVVGYNIWKHLKLKVGADAYSLNSIEHDVLRKMDEPRIHFAIVCASIGCPRLLNQAYTAEDLDDQLASNTKDFFSRPQNLQFDGPSSTLKYSRIIDWFGADFGAGQTKQLDYLFPYFPENVQKQVRVSSSAGKLRIGYLEYDWDLNKQK